MEYNIRGTTMPMLDVNLDPGEAIFTESGGMAWMKGPVDMQTGTRGGLLKALARVASGDSLFLTTYRATGSGTSITFVPRTIGKIVPVPLASGQSLICAKDSFMCAQDTVALEVIWRPKLMVGLAGGMGFILQKVTGPGTAFLEVSGEVAAYALEPGEVMKVDQPHIAFFEPSVQHSVERVKGFKNIIGGGEGFFLATLTGPGKVWLRSLPLANLAGEIARYLPSKG